MLDICFGICTTPHQKSNGPPLRIVRLKNVHAQKRNEIDLLKQFCFIGFLLDGGGGGWGGVNFQSYFP